MWLQVFPVGKGRIAWTNQACWVIQSGIRPGILAEYTNSLVHNTSLLNSQLYRKNNFVNHIHNFQQTLEGGTDRQIVTGTMVIDCKELSSWEIEKKS